MSSIHRVKTGHQVRYRDPQGKGLKETFRLLDDARAFKTSMDNAKLTGTYVERSGETFASIAHQWLASNPAKRKTTYARDAMVVRVHLEPVIGRVKLVDLRPSHCRAVVTVMEGRPLKAKTIHTNIGVLRAVLNWAVDSDLLARSPFRGIRLPPIPPSRARTANGEDVLRLADAIPLDYRVAIFLGALGLRMAEVMGLRVGSIDFLRKRMLRA